MHFALMSKTTQGPVRSRSSPPAPWSRDLSGTGLHARLALTAVCRSPLRGLTLPFRECTAHCSKYVHMQAKAQLRVCRTHARMRKRRGVFRERLPASSSHLPFRNHSFICKKIFDWLPTAARIPKAECRCELTQHRHAASDERLCEVARSDTAGMIRPRFMNNT